MYPNDERGRCSYSLLKLIRPVQSLDKIYKQDTLKQYIQGFLFICVLWGMGGSLNDTHKSLLNQHIVNEIFSHGKYEDDFIFLPDQVEKSYVNFFDYMIETNNSGQIFYNQWKDYISGKQFINIDNNIYLQTVPIQYCKYFLKYCNNSHTPIIFLGGSSTLKTTSIYLSLNVNKSSFFRNIEWGSRIPYNSSTNPENVNNTIVNYMRLFESGKYKPHYSNKIIIFIDDLSVYPENINKYGNNLENLRQIHQCKLLSLDNNLTENLIPIQALSMIYTINISNPKTKYIDQRFHKPIIKIYLEGLSESEIHHFFSTTINNHFSVQFSKSVIDSSSLLVNLTLNTIKKFSKLVKSVPYSFLIEYDSINIMKILKYLLMVTPRTIKTEFDLVRLWYHEMNRTFIDSLLNPEHAKQFKEILEKDIFETFTNFKREDLFQIKENLPNEVIYTNILSVLEKENYYSELTEPMFKQLQLEIKVAIDTYNRSSTDSINLSIFPTVIHDILCISRMLSYSKENILLLGIPGSGRRSIIKLISSLLSYEFKSLSIDPLSTTSYEMWKRNISKILLESGEEPDESQKQYLICCDESIFNCPDILSDIELLLEDNTNLNHLFYKPVILDEINKIKPIIYERNKKEREFIQIPPKKLTTSIITDSKIFDYFVNKAKSRIHIVICSSYKKEISNIYDNFPSLKKLFKPYIISPWNYDAKVQVANSFITRCGGNTIAIPPLLFSESKVQMDEHYSVTSKLLAKFHDILLEELSTSVDLFCVRPCSSENTIRSSTSSYYEQLVNNSIYTSPLSFCCFVKNFLEIYINKRVEYTLQFKKLEKGIKQMQSLKDIVYKMEKVLYI